MPIVEQDLVAAPAAPAILPVLTQGENYGYAIVKTVREMSARNVEWADGMFYPLLHRLHRLGYVTTDLRTPRGLGLRRYYAITDGGRAALAEHERYISDPQAVERLDRGTRSH